MKFILLVLLSFFVGCSMFSPRNADRTPQSIGDDGSLVLRARGAKVTITPEHVRRLIGIGGHRNEGQRGSNSLAVSEVVFGRVQFPHLILVPFSRISSNFYSQRHLFLRVTSSKVSDERIRCSLQISFVVNTNRGFLTAIDCGNNDFKLKDDHILASFEELGIEIVKTGDEREVIE